VVPHGVLVPREVRGEFWGLVRGGLTPAQAAVELGVSKAAGNKWFRDAGGVLPRVDACPADPSRRTITLAERESIGLLRAAGMGVRAIARELGRQPGVISKEIARNLNRAGDYRPLHAQSRAEQRSRRAKPAKLAQLGPLRDFVVAGLKEAWSPEQISNVLRVEFPDDPAMRACPETIYQALYVQSRGALRRDLAAKLRSGRATRKLRRPATHEERRGRLANTISISQRPAEAADRAVPGHWEGDLILGANNRSAIGTLVERSTRFCMLLHLPGPSDAIAVRDQIVATIGTLPAFLRRSLTWDQGLEMRRHAEITVAADLPVYFCDPQAPWQRGSNENTNGLLRQYFPKGSDLSLHSPEHLTRVAAELNGRPRKTLGWDTPAEAMAALLSTAHDDGVASAP
jgi:transposase, IS30 family